MFFDDPPVEQAKKVTCPILLCPAGNDGADVKDGGEVQAAIRAKNLTCKCVEFPEMKHGWVPRGDASDDNVARDVKLAIETCTNFFTETLNSANM